MINFNGKKILITGASGGIGTELVKKFVSLGGSVLGSGTKTDKLDNLKKQNPQIKVMFKDMFPVDLTTLQFDATTEDINYLTASVTFKYTIYDITNLSGTKL